jgi:hypothetical protein
MPSMIKVNKVHLVIFNNVVLTQSIFGKTARVNWKTSDTGSVIRRDMKTGRFCSLPFTVVANKYAKY